MKFAKFIIGCLIMGLLTSCLVLVFIELPKAKKQGFGQGYVCAFDHEVKKNSNYIVYETEKSEYCEKFSTLFDEAIEDMIK